MPMAVLNMKTSFSLLYKTCREKSFKADKLSLPHGLDSIFNSVMPCYFGITWETLALSEFKTAA